MEVYRSQPTDGTVKLHLPLGSLVELKIRKRIYAVNPEGNGTVSLASPDKSNLETYITKELAAYGKGKAITLGAGNAGKL
jgi:hypothetical protein